MNTCERCNGTGLEDSGGVQPWGEPILVECECRLMERNMDESRKQFEAEMEKLGDCVDMRLAKNGDEEYMEWDVRLAWEMWIEIELPRRKAAYASGYGDGYLVDSLMGDALDYDETVEAISAAGIKVKE